MEQQNSNKALQYILPAIGIGCVLTILMLFILPGAMNVILGIFICMLLALFIYNIVMVTKKNVERIGNKLSIRDIFFKKFLFDINNIQKIEVHTNFLCRIYDIKIIKIQEQGTEHQFYVSKIKPEELNKIVSSTS